MRSDIAAEAVDAAFADLGVTASYAPPAGEAASCRVITRQPDETVEFGVTKAVIASTIIEVRASEVAAPEKGGVFAVDGTSYRIIAKPKRKDSARLIWRCEAEEAA